MGLPLESFDLVISQRCLINLSGWEEQQIALAEIARILNPGGRFIMQEGTLQSREALNHAPEEPAYDAPINEIAYRVAAEAMGLNGQRQIAREFSLVLQRL